MKTRSTSRLNSQQEKNIPNVRKALRAGPRTRSEARVLLTFQKSSSESSDLVSEKVVKNTFKTPERDGILPDFSDTEKLSQTTTITHKQIEENSQSLKDYGTLPDNSVLGFTKPADSFWWKHLDESFQPSFQQSGEGILLGKDSHLGDSTIKNMSPVWYKHISSSLLATPVVRRADGTVKNSSANISNEKESCESSPVNLAKKLFRNKKHTHANPFQKIMDTHDSSLEQTLHNSGGYSKKSNHGKKHKMSIKSNILLKEDENRNSSDTDISFKLPRPHKLFKGIKNKALVNKDLFRKALQDTMESSEENNIDLQSGKPEKTTKRMPDKDSDDDISIELQNPTRLFKRRKTKAFVNKDLFQRALQNTSNSLNDVVNDLQFRKSYDTSTKHLSGSDISDDDISLKASRPTKLFKGRKAKTLVNKDLFQKALQNTKNSPNDAINDLKSITPEPSAKHLSGSDISDEDIPLKASRPPKLFKGRKVKTLVNKDLFQEALQNTKNSPNDAINDLKSITPEPSAKHLSGSDISDEDISVKASRLTKLFKGRKVKRLVNKDLFQEALQNTKNSPNDAVNDLKSITPEPSAKHLSGSDISDEDISVKASRPTKLFKGRKVKRLVNKDLFQEALQNTKNSPNDAVNDLKSITPEPSAKHLSGSDISDEDISVKASRPTKLFKGRKVKTLVNKDLFQEALQNTKNSPNDAVNDLKSITPEPSAKHLSGSDISDEDISVKASRPTKLFKGRKVKTLVNKDLFQEALNNTSNSPNDSVTVQQSIIPEPSAKHLSGSDISDEDNSLKASRPKKLFKGKKTQTLANKDLFQKALHNNTKSFDDTIKNVDARKLTQSTQRLPNINNSGEELSPKTPHQKIVFMERKTQSLVNNDLIQQYLQSSPLKSMDVINDAQFGTADKSTHYLNTSKKQFKDTNFTNSTKSVLYKKSLVPVIEKLSQNSIAMLNSASEKRDTTHKISSENDTIDSEIIQSPLNANKKKTRNIVGDTSKRVEEKSRTLQNEQESITSFNKSKELSHNIHSTKKSNQMYMVKSTTFSENLTPYDNFSPHITKVMSSTRLTPSFFESETNPSQTANKGLQSSKNNAQTKVKINTIVSQENESSGTHNNLHEKSSLQSFPNNEKTMKSPVSSLSSRKSRGKVTHDGQTSLKTSEINSVLTDEVLSKLSVGPGQSHISKEEFSRTKNSSKHADELIRMDPGNMKNINSFSELGDNELNAKSKSFGDSFKDIEKAMILLHGEEESSDSNRESTAHKQTSESVQKTRLSKTAILNIPPDPAVILTNVHKENSGIDNEQSLQFANKDRISEDSLKHIETPFKGTISHNSGDESIVVTKQIQKTDVFKSNNHEESLKKLEKSLFIAPLDNTNSVTRNKSIGTQPNPTTTHARRALFIEPDKLLQNVEKYSLVHKNRKNMATDEESRDSISCTISNSNKGNSGETLNPSQSPLMKRRAAIKAVIQRVKEKMARNICMDTEIINLTTTKQFPNYFSHALKINDLTTKPAVKKIEQKSVNPDFLVNGQVYRAPRLSKPARWVTTRLYNLLMKKCELKYGRLKARRKAEGFVLGLYEVVKIVSRRKIGLEMYVKRMQKQLFQLGIIESLHDFYQFVKEYLPEQFCYKVVYCTRAFGKTSGIPYGPNTNIYAKLRFN